MKEVIAAAELAAKMKPTSKVMAMRPIGCFLHGRNVEVSSESADVIVLPHARGSGRQNLNRPFWIIVSPENIIKRRSYLIHTDLSKAIVEAERLSRKFRGNSMLIMESVFGAMYSNADVTEFVRVGTPPQK